MNKIHLLKLFMDPLKMQVNRFATRLVSPVSELIAVRLQVWKKEVPG